MVSATHTAPVVRTTLWTGRIISALVILFMAFDSIIKVLQLAPAVEATTLLGYPASLVLMIGVIEILCLAVYVIPRTALLGAVLLTGYLGGAVASQVRIEAPLFAVVFPLIVAVLVWGGAIAAFGLVPWLPLGLAMLALAGAADVVSAVFRNTILQMSVPDGLRGRLSSVHIAVVTGGPQLGDAEAGAVAAIASPRVSVVSGGLACIVGVLVLLRLVPELARYDAEAQTRRSDG